MTFIVWNDRLSVDVASVDREHKELIGILNDLYDAIARNCAQQAVREALQRLTAYTEYHFRHEEALFSRTAYPDIVLHKRQHADMVSWLAACQRRHDDDPLSTLSLEMVNYLKDWLFDHILGSDRQITQHLHAAGID